MNSKEAFQTFQALKLHFKYGKNYDFFLYNGKSYGVKQISSHTYDLFGNISNKYKSDLFEFYLSNIVENPNVMIHDLFKEESYEIFTNWKKRNQSLTFNFKNDIMSLVEEDSFKNWFSGESPLLLTKTYRSEINFESFCILYHMFDLDNRWKQNLGEDLIWKPFSFKCRKYHPFIKYDKKNILSTMKEYVM